MRHPLIALAVLIAAASAATPRAARPPQAGAGPVRFVVLGNSGTGDKHQYDLAAQMARLHERWTFGHVILLGGNILGSSRPQDFLKKFETPYRPLLDAGVKFNAVVGADDSGDQRFYKLFNMGGKLHYAFSPSREVRFFVLESAHPGPEQVAWLERELQASEAAWKVAFSHGAAARGALEPLLVRHNVRVLMTAEEQAYVRQEPPQGIVSFIVGSSGKLRSQALDGRHAITAGFDDDRVFLAAEIAGDELSFRAISTTGAVVDSGVVRRLSVGRR